MYTRLIINFSHICALTYLYCVGPKIFPTLYIRSLELYINVQVISLAIMEGNGSYFGLRSPDLLRNIERPFPCKIREYVDLSQLVVGDQFNGKSSILEALTKPSFPWAIVVTMRLLEWHASSDPSHSMTIKKRNPCFDIATLEII